MARTNAGGLQLQGPGAQNPCGCCGTDTYGIGIADDVTGKLLCRRCDLIIKSARGGTLDIENRDKTKAFPVGLRDLASLYLRHGGRVPVDDMGSDGTTKRTRKPRAYTQGYRVTSHQGGVRPLQSEEGSDTSMTCPTEAVESVEAVELVDA
jgi:hypothetical protein